MENKALNKFAIGVNIAGQIMKFLFKILTLFLLLISVSVRANYTCSGSVRGVSIDAQSGDILVESIGAVSWPRLCNLRITSNSIAPETCKSIYASLLAAQATGKSVTYWVISPEVTCQASTPWLNVNGFYFLRVDG